jgi:hypothetical protein
MGNKEIACVGGVGGVGSIELDQDRVQWRALVLEVMNFRVLLLQLVHWCV